MLASVCGVCVECVDVLLIWRRGGGGGLVDVDVEALRWVYDRRVGRVKPARLRSIIFHEYDRGDEI